MYFFAELEQLLHNPSQFPGSKEAKELSQKVCCNLKYTFVKLYYKYKFHP